MAGRIYRRRGGEFALVYCTDDEPDADIVGLSPAIARASLDRWHQERSAADELIAGCTSLDASAAGNRYSVRWNLLRVIQEYARHNGHADIIRERIDGARGE